MRKLSSMAAMVFLALGCGGVNVPSLDFGTDPSQVDVAAEQGGQDVQVPDQTQEMGQEARQEVLDTSEDEAAQEVAQGCKSDKDCVDGCGGVCKDGHCEYALSCDDSNPCTKDYCDEKTHECRHESLNDVTCDDNNPCTKDDKCFEGACAGIADTCDDNNACTVDLCSPAKGGCFHQPSGAEQCDDGDPCTASDRCVDTKCVGGALVLCDDKNPCTDDSCDPKTGKCMFVWNEAPCDDGDPCTTEHICSSGKCVGTKTLDCNDNEECTKDSCVPMLGCQHEVLPGCLACNSDKDCDDKNPCTLDYCDENGQCASKVLDGAGCEDGNLCTVGDRCEGSVCKAGEPRSCEDNNPCTVGECKPATGECVQLPADGPCDDNNPCTKDDKCQAGACVGVVVTCPKNGPCVFGQCNIKTGECVDLPVPDDSPCDDGDKCTTGDVCKSGKCFGQPLSCDDQDPCTIDSCTGGQCTHSPIATCQSCKNDADCDDKNPCTSEKCDNGKCTFAALSDVPCTLGDMCIEGMTCVLGACKGGTPVKCDDGNLCTTDKCDSAVGCVHENNQAPCDDGNKCTVGDRCSNGVCKPGEGTLACDDGNQCTDDSCDQVKGCVFANNTSVCAQAKCDGLTWYQQAVCSGGFCPKQIAVSCDDHNPCTLDKCDALKGCLHEPADAACDDGNACTKGDHCGPDGKCVPGDAVVCDDKNPCTDDFCDPAKGCVSKNNTASCEDGDQCTVGDICQDGKCMPGKPRNCDDNNLCTDDSCDPSQGCINKNNTRDCEDGSKCTAGDKCTDGQCQPGLPMTCNDNNPCTDDTCDPIKGCVYTNNTRPCEDGDMCTEGDVCSGGVCKSGQQKNCDDNNVCTSDSCNRDEGCKHMNLSGGTCNDGNACTVNDTCVSGVCKGQGKDCNDSNPCTTDSCDPQTQQCTNVPVPDGTQCDDGDRCTIKDACVKGKCLGTAVLCNDGNVCTDDYCDPATGKCASKYNTAPCDDGNKCTIGDKCSNGSCMPGLPVLCTDKNPCTDDKCDPAQGCVHPPNTAPCDDGNKCTQNDVCSGGVCKPGTQVVCNDNNVCTDDSCDPQTGNCVFTANTNKCDDGNKCTLNDVCSKGQCKGTPMNCDDGNPCTNDSCFLGLCYHFNVTDGTACNDNNACTTNDQCQSGKCVGSAVDCGTKVCHTTTCDPAKGCVYTPVTGSCDDGRSCTQNDTCGKLADGSWGCVSGSNTCVQPNPDCTTDASAPCKCCVLFSCTYCDPMSSNTCSSKLINNIIVPTCKCGSNPACSGSTPCCKSNGTCAPKTCFPGPGGTVICICVPE